MRCLSVVAGVGLLLGVSAAGAGELPPPGSKPLSSILASVQAQKLGTISEAEFDDGWWEVKVCQADACQKLYLDPKSGAERRRRKSDAERHLPPAGGRPLAEIVQSIEARGLGTITEVEFDDGLWKVDLRQDGRRSKLAVDPVTGETRR